MILKTSEIKDVCTIIGNAVSMNECDLNSNIEILVDGNDTLYLNVTNSEFFVKVSYPVEGVTSFRAVINAKQFLGLVSKISVDTFEMTIDGNTLKIFWDKNKYNLPMIYQDDMLMKLPKITLSDTSVFMTIKNEIFESVYNINRKEHEQNLKVINVSELQKFFYITENGAFNFTTGACLNSFELEKPIKLLLNERIVNLFKLFKKDVSFRFGHDTYGGNIITKAEFISGNVQVTAIIQNDETLLNQVQRPLETTKKYINEEYPIKAVVSVSSFLAAVSRLKLFNRNSFSTSKKVYGVKMSISAENIVISDDLNNTEVITIENESFVTAPYSFKVNLNEIETILGTCTMDHITFSCGQSRVIVITRGTVKNLLTEMD